MKPTVTQITTNTSISNISGALRTLDNRTHKEVLDLVIGPDKFFITGLEVDQALSNSDHYSINFRFPLEQKCFEKIFYDYRKCNKLKSFLSHINWNIVFQNCDDANAFWSEFSNVLSHGIDNCLEKKRQFNRIKHSFPISEGTRNCIDAVNGYINSKVFLVYFRYFSKFLYIIYRHVT